MSSVRLNNHKAAVLTIVLGIILLTGTAVSDDSTMTYIEYRMVSNTIEPDSWQAQPKQAWRVGRTYCRTLEAPDTTQGLQILSVSNNRDHWMVNLLSNQGFHAFDTAESYNTILPTVGEPGYDLYLLPEFGREILFFESHETLQESSDTIDGIPCEKMSIETEYMPIDLFVRDDTHLPYQLVHYWGDDTVIVIYDQYLIDLPIDSSLFTQPTGVKWIKR